MSINFLILSVKYAHQFPLFFNKTMHENMAHWKLLLENTIIDACQVYYMEKTLFISPCNLTQLGYYKLEYNLCPVSHEVL